MKRQEILHRAVPPTLSFVIWEAALQDRIGGDEVYREQVRHLRTCAERPAISIQVLPLGLTAHAGLNGAFIVLETPEFQHLAYSETQRGSFLVRDRSVGPVARRDMSTPLKWFKSSYSGDEGGACVEVAACPAEQVHVRDSKVADGPVLTLAPAAWNGLTRWVRS